MNDQIAERSKFLDAMADLIKSGTAPNVPAQMMSALAKFRDLESKIQFLRDHMISDLQQTAPLYSRR